MDKGKPSKQGTKLSNTGESFYRILEVPKTATVEEINKSYKRLALKYHPDKNPGDPAAEEKFKEINKAHSTLTNESKRKWYDAYGSEGLKLADQIGEENFQMFMLFRSRRFQCLATCCFLATCCCFCCFCCCMFCCHFCCTHPDIDDKKGGVTIQVTNEPEKEEVIKSV